MQLSGGLVFWRFAAGSAQLCVVWQVRHFRRNADVVATLLTNFTWGSWQVMQPSLPLLAIVQRLMANCSGWLSALIFAESPAVSRPKIETTLSNNRPGRKSR